MVLHSFIDERNLLVFIVINLQKMHNQIIVLQLMDFANGTML
jgi:hypothetical protein